MSLEVMEKMMKMQEKMEKSHKSAGQSNEEEQAEVLTIGLKEEERFEDDEAGPSESRPNFKDAREMIQAKRRLSQNQEREGLKVTIHQQVKGKGKEQSEKSEGLPRKNQSKKDQEAQTPRSALERHPNETIARRLLDRVGDVHWRHFPGINSITDFNCDPCLKFNRGKCDEAHPHKEGGRVVRDICEICRFAAAVNNHHSAEDCDLESKLYSFVARKKRQEREHHNRKHMAGGRGERGGKERKEEEQKRSK